MKRIGLLSLHRFVGLCIAATAYTVFYSLKTVQQQHPKAKLIVGCSTEDVDHFIPCSYHYVFEELEKVHGWDFYVPNENSTTDLVDLNPKVLLFCREEVKYIKSWPISKLKEQGTIMALYIEDLPLFSRMGLKSSFVKTILSQIDVLLGPAIYRATSFYQPYFGDHIPELYWMPHSASSAFVNVTINMAPKVDIFFSGAVNQAYPVRQWIAKTLLPSNRVNISRHQHPGYSKKLARSVTNEYAMSIRSHLAATSTTSLYRYVVAKTFEISATGSLLMTNLDMEEAFQRLGLVNGVHYVGFDDDDPTPKFEWVLDPQNRKKVDEIRRNGMDFVRSYHTVRNRAHDLNEYFDKGTQRYSAKPLYKTYPCPMVTFKTVNECKQKFSSCCMVESLAN